MACPGAADGSEKCIKTGTTDACADGDTCECACETGYAEDSSKACVTGKVKEIIR